MQATAETIQFEAEVPALANANVPAIIGRPFDYGDIGSQAVPWAIYKDPASAIAEASNTRQQCARIILQPPHLVEAVMENPGPHEQTTIRLSYKAAPGCDPWWRLSQYRPRVERNGHLVDMSKPKWYPIRMGGDRSTEAHVSIITDTATQGIYPRCVNGHRERVVLSARTQMKPAHGDHVIGTGKTKTWPVEFDPNATASC